MAHLEGNRYAYAYRKRNRPLLESRLQQEAVLEPTAGEPSLPSSPSRQLDRQSPYRIPLPIAIVASHMHCERGWALQVEIRRALKCVGNGENLLILEDGSHDVDRCWERCRRRREWTQRFGTQ